MGEGASKYRIYLNRLRKLNIPGEVLYVSSSEFGQGRLASTSDGDWIRITKFRRFPGSYFTVGEQAVVQLRAHPEPGRLPGDRRGSGIAMLCSSEWVSKFPELKKDDEFVEIEFESIGILEKAGKRIRGVHYLPWIFGLIFGVGIFFGTYFGLPSSVTTIGRILISIAVALGTMVASLRGIELATKQLFSK